MEAIQLSMGLPASWVKLITECISTVNYRVKFNDSISDIFYPKRGLRQGDPLSPTYFYYAENGYQEQFPLM